jgi:hypothetical protein
MCAQEMMDVSDVIFREHYSEYLSKIILPNLTKLLAEHVGGAIWSVPFSIILATGLVMAMLFIDPWVAAWGAAITAMHLGLVTTLAMMVGPYSYYFLTSEPVFFASLALMTGMALTSFHHTTVSQRR